MPKAASVADVSHNACPATHTYSDLNLHTFFQSKKRIEIVYICMSFAWLGLWPALDTTPIYIGHNTCLRRPVLWPASATTPLIYIVHNIYLRRPKQQHLSFVSTKILACTGQNTGHNTSMCQQKYWPVPATTVKIPVYVGQSCDLCWPQHLLTSASAVTCIGHNTSHLRRPKHLFMSASAVTCIGQNISLRRPKHIRKNLPQ